MFQANPKKSSVLARFFREDQPKSQTGGPQLNKTTTTNSKSYSVDTCLEVLFHLLHTAKLYMGSNEKEQLAEYIGKYYRQMSSMHSFNTRILRREREQLSDEYHHNQYKREEELMGIGVLEMITLLFDETVDELLKGMEIGQPSEPLLYHVKLLKFGAQEFLRHSSTLSRNDLWDYRIYHLGKFEKEIRSCEAATS